MKKCSILLLPNKDLKQLIISPKKTMQLVSTILEPYGPQGQGYFYKYDVAGFYDGVFWGLMRIKGPGGKLQYQDLRVWSDFVRAITPSRLNMYLGLAPGLPKVDNPENSLAPDGLPTVFTLCRNLMPVAELLRREDPFLEIGVILDGDSKWTWRSNEYGRGRLGLKKWIETAIPVLRAFSETHYALCLTLQLGEEPVIPTNENPKEFTAPEEPRY